VNILLAKPKNGFSKEFPKYDMIVSHEPMICCDAILLHDYFRWFQLCWDMLWWIIYVYLLWFTNDDECPLNGIKNKCKCYMSMKVKEIMIL
jgi:hypothetical protein